MKSKRDRKRRSSAQKRFAENFKNKWANPPLNLNRIPDTKDLTVEDVFGAKFMDFECANCARIVRQFMTPSEIRAMNERLAGEPLKIEKDKLKAQDRFNLPFAATDKQTWHFCSYRCAQQFQKRDTSFDKMMKKRLSDAKKE